MTICPKCGDKGLFYQAKSMGIPEAIKCYSCGFFYEKNSLPFAHKEQIATTKHNKDNVWKPDSFMLSNNGSKTQPQLEGLQLNSEL